MSTFSNAFSGYCIHGVSAIDSSVLLRGRPHRGMLIMFPDSMFNFGNFLIKNVITFDQKEIERKKRYLVGIIIFFFTTYGSKVTIIETVSKRLCAIKLKLDNLSILSFCIYLLYETNNHNLLEEYQSVLSEILL